TQVVQHLVWVAGLAEGAGPGEREELAGPVPRLTDAVGLEQDPVTWGALAPVPPSSGPALSTSSGGGCPRFSSSTFDPSVLACARMAVTNCSSVSSRATGALVP